MKHTFTVDDEGNVTTHTSRKEAEQFASDHEGDYCAGFDSSDSLESVLATAPAGLAALIWNGLPGVKPLDRFKSRKIAAERIFRYLQGRGDESEFVKAHIDEAAEPVAQTKKAKATRKAAKEPKPRKSAKKVKAGKKSAKHAERVARKSSDTGSKKSQVIEMISKKGGATLDAIMETTGWLRHGVRGFVATLKTKGGLNVESVKDDDGRRRYRIA